jgi:hypothetical protein
VSVSVTVRGLSSLHWWRAVSSVLVVPSPKSQRTNDGRTSGSVAKLTSDPSGTT